MVLSSVIRPDVSEKEAGSRSSLSGRARPWVHPQYGGGLGGRGVLVVLSHRGSPSVQEALGWVTSTWGKGGGDENKCKPIEPDTERRIKLNGLSYCMLAFIIKYPIENPLIGPKMSFTTSWSDSPFAPYLEQVLTLSSRMTGP